MRPDQDFDYNLNWPYEDNDGDLPHWRASDALVLRGGVWWWYYLSDGDWFDHREATTDEVIDALMADRESWRKMWHDDFKYSQIGRNVVDLLGKYPALPATEKPDDGRGGEG